MNAVDKPMARQLTKNQRRAVAFISVDFQCDQRYD